MFTRLFVATYVAAALPSAFAQAPPSPCSVVSLDEAKKIVAVNGESELTNDLVFTCTNGTISSTVLPPLHLNIEMFLNTNITSRMNSPQALDTVLLLDEPAAAIQALNTNVFRGTLGQGQNNLVTWTAIPVPAGTHKYRITTIRANAHLIGIVGAPVEAVLAISGPNVNYQSPATVLAILETPLTFSTSPIVANVTPVSGLNLNFKEGYVSAFKKRIENTSGGPFTYQYQDVPGLNYCTESGFTPKFQALPIPAGMGLADTSTRLLATLSNLPASVFMLVVPFEVNSSSGQMVAHLIMPPYGNNHQSGMVTTISGSTMLPVNPVTHSVELVYELAAASPFANVNGCAAADTISIPVEPFFQASLASATITGVLAPDDPASALPVAAGANAPEPRFVH